MAIYGTALLSICLIAGLLVGKLLGISLGIDANVGGVGIAMLLLILSCDWMRKKGRMEPLTESGVKFWSAIYIPIVVAMAAKQNVIAAVEGGLLAVVAGVLSVVACFAMVPLLSSFGSPEKEDL